MKTCKFVVGFGLSALLAVSLPANAEEHKRFSKHVHPILNMDIASLLKAKYPKGKWGKEKDIKQALLKIDRPGAHLENDQCLRIIGPIDAGPKTIFNIIPAVCEDVNPPAPALTWMPGSYDATESLLGTYSFEIKVSSTDFPHNPSPPTSHTCGAQIVTDSDGAKDITIECDDHSGLPDGSGITDHGGSAHGTR